jgi:alpha-1,2-mannosyltransferase
MAGQTRRSDLRLRIFGWGWLALMVISVPSLLSFGQPNIWQIGRTWYLAWGEMVYPTAAPTMMGWIIATGRHRG